MSQAMIAFSAGLIVGGLGGISLIGIFLLMREDRARLEGKKRADNPSYLRKSNRSLKPSGV